ncbi:MAG: PQQ-binding-like beta-propeller repeat protein [Chloroflexi bacterium]|nr:PQQ-binding-like beta-propeller repeat protein [Chloroflexota bacterium]
MGQQTQASLGPYAIQESLGTTGLATVYRALDAQGHPVAVKVLRSYFAQEVGLVEAFFKALDPVRRLRHPLILPLLECSQDGQTFWLVTPYVPWRTLRDLLQGKPLPPSTALPILRQVGEALDYAHAQGVLHGDLKPSNVFVSDEGRVLVADFGMAALVKGIHPLMRSTLNTPLPTHTAPEQAHGISLERRSDIYSLGTLAYEMLTGTIPFFAVGAPAVLAKQLTSRPPPPTQFNPALSPEVDKVVLRALARRPEERHGVAGEFVAALRDSMGSLSDASTAPSTAGGAGVGLPPAGVPGQTRLSPEAVPKDAAAPEVSSRLCPLCDQANPTVTADFCSRCWARLDTYKDLAPEVAERLRLGRARARRLQRILQLAAIATVALGVSLFALYRIVGTAPLVPAPTSTISSDSGPGEWAMFGRDPAHTGFSPQGADLRGQARWVFRTTEPLLASPVVARGRVFLATGDRRVVALEATNGTLLWETPVTGPVDASPALADGLLYVGLRDGRLLALDAETGAIRWSFKTGNPIFSSPVVHRGLLYLSSSDGFLYGLDARTGEKRWGTEIEGWTLSSPVVGGGVVVPVSVDGRLYVVDAVSGRKRLSYDLVYGAQSSPAFAGDRLFIGSMDGRIRAIDWRKIEYPMERGWMRFRLQLFVWGVVNNVPPQKGFLWQTLLPKTAIVGSPAVVEDTLYVGAANGKLYALDGKTGKERWEFATGGAIAGGASVAGDVVFVGSGDSKVYGVNRHSGQQVWEFLTQGPVMTTPVLAGDTLYVASRDGTLYALR